MNAAFISDETNRDQNKHHDENDALFVFGEIENSKQAFHRVVATFALDFGTPFSSLGFLQVVILSEAKNLSHFFLYATELNNQRCFASLNMTRTAYFA